MDRIKEVDSEKYPQIDDRLDDLLIHQLYQTMRAFSKTLNSEIYTADVYSSEWSILKMVKEHDNISQLELANCLNVEPAAISKTIKKMEEKNLVKRQRIQGKREKYIFLTEHAIELYDFLEKRNGSSSNGAGSYLNSFWSSAIVSVISKWIKDGMKIPAEKIATLGLPLFPQKKK